MTEPATAIEICRFLHDSALLMLWGSSAFVAFLLPASLRAETSLRLGIFPITAVVVAALTAAMALPLQAAALGSGWPDASDPKMLRAVLLDSPVGLALQVQAVAGVLLLLAFALPANWRMAALAVAAAVGLGALALTGHASMAEGPQRVIHRANDIVHLLSAGAWLGALIPFVVVLRMLAVPGLHEAAGVALRRFSLAGHGAVFLVLATGMVNSWLILGRLPTDWSSPYQLLLSLKIIVVCAMTGLAVVNRYVFVPDIGDHPEATVQAIRLASVIEILLGMAAIGLVAVFGTLDPAA